MNPFNRAKLKDEKPEPNWQAQINNLQSQINNLVQRLDVRPSALPVAKRPSYFAEISYDSFSRVAAARQERDDLRKENARLRQENTALDAMCDQLRIAGDQQAATIANLEREREHIREGREKAVARCGELEKANQECQYRLANIRNEVDGLPPWARDSYTLCDLVAACR